jgi:hypothetical protein
MLRPDNHIVDPSVRFGGNHLALRKVSRWPKR